MKKLQATFLLLCVFACSLSYGQSSTLIKEYIEAYKDIAIAEMHRTGVPAAIKLAQGIHETAAGTSHLVRSSNNHFGIKCKSEWKGEWVKHDDDAKGECFRKYSDPFQSYKDHSDFLKTRAHYASLFELDPTDYESWAHGLKKAGYATNPKYPQIIIKLIKDYNLQDYTLIALNKKEVKQPVLASAPANEQLSNTKATFALGVSTPKKKKNYPSGVFTINDTKVVFVQEGTSFLKVAEDHNISLARLFEFNDLQPQEIADNDYLIYLQRKRKTGANEFHIVQAGETLHEIAQAEGIRKESLLAYNLLQEGMQPNVGEKLYLKTKAPAMPKLAVPESNTEHNFTAFPTEEPSSTGSLIHVVQPKETMYSISKKYDVEIEDVVKWNDLDTVELKIGQQLKINKKAANVSNQSSR